MAAVTRSAASMVEEAAAFMVVAAAGAAATGAVGTGDARVVGLMSSFFVQEGNAMSLASKGVRTVVIAGVVAGLLLGCGVQAESSSVGGSFSSAGSGSSSGGVAATAAPTLVVVDANRTMAANPGQGVGVFTQYQSGGHWNVWWSCDTTVTSLPCAFDIRVSVASGTFSNLAGQGLNAGDSVAYSGDLQPGAASSAGIHATTTTTNAVQGMTFDTPLSEGTPIITLEAKLSGQDDGSYFFFVQDGVINGGYTGSFSDPLMFEPSSP